MLARFCTALDLTPASTPSSGSRRRDRVMRRIEPGGDRRGAIGERVWLYSNYHCNLRCGYCLTESAPRSREADHERRGEMVESPNRRGSLGFRALGVTGGEPFLVPEMPELLGDWRRGCPSSSSATRRCSRETADPHAAALGRAGASQVSLDSAEPDVNDGCAHRTTSKRSWPQSPRSSTPASPCASRRPATRTRRAQMERCARCTARWVCPDADHVVRPIVRRGRALEGKPEWWRRPRTSSRS